MRLLVYAAGVGLIQAVRAVASVLLQALQINQVGEIISNMVVAQPAQNVTQNANSKDMLMESAVLNKIMGLSLVHTL